MVLIIMLVLLPFALLIAVDSVELPAISAVVVSVVIPEGTDNHTMHCQLDPEACCFCLSILELSELGQA